MFSYFSCILFLCCCSFLGNSVSHGAKKANSISLSYPIIIHEKTEKLLPVNKDSLTCIPLSKKNGDSLIHDIHLIFSCILPLRNTNCEEIWGSRAIILQVIGDVELLEIKSHSHSVINCDRLVELISNNATSIAQQILHVPFDLQMVCVRSVQYELSQFRLLVKGVTIRDADQSKLQEHLIYHFGMLLLVSSTQILPYLFAVIASVLFYFHGIKYMILLLSGSVIFLATTPLMLTQKYRHLLWLYVKYFFSRSLAIEAKQFIRQKKFVLQSLYFMSLTIVSGSATAYFSYHYFGLSREMRNLLVRLVLAASVAWFTFFLARLFDNFLSSWCWILLSLMSLNVAEQWINPRFRSKLFILLFCLSLSVVLGRKLFAKQFTFNSWLLITKGWKAN